MDVFFKIICPSFIAVALFCLFVRNRICPKCHKSYKMWQEQNIVHGEGSKAHLHQHCPICGEDLEGRAYID